MASKRNSVKKKEVNGRWKKKAEGKGTEKIIENSYDEKEERKLFANQMFKKYYQKEQKKPKYGRNGSRRSR